MCHVNKIKLCKWNNVTKHFYEFSNIKSQSIKPVCSIRGFSILIIVIHSKAEYVLINYVVKFFTCM